MTPRPLLLSLLVALLAACVAPAAAPSVPTDASPETTAPPSAAAYPLTLTDDAGREVTIEAEPQRVVSLAPSNSEIVCALDACDRLVGVTDFDDHPPEVAEVEKVVVSAQVDVEKVVAVDPDLVLAAGNELTPSAVIERLDELGYPVLTLYPETLDEVYGDIELVGQALGARDEASAVVEGMRARAADVERALADVERPRTFYEVSLFEGTIYTAGEGSFLASLIETAGGAPITGDALTFTIELEELVAADPQVILLGDATYDPSLATPDEALAAVAARPGWDGMAAVQQGRVVPFLEDVVTTRPGPRIVDGLEALARAIHPELFE